MSVGPLVTEICCTFFVAAFLLHRYGNWSQHHILVTINVFIAWYFSFIIIFILPLDVSTTAYHQCIRNSESTTDSSIIPTVTETTVLPNESFRENISEISIQSYVAIQEPTGKSCQAPWSQIPEGVLPTLWRVVYWTAQALTWIILPMMQSYSTAGDFTVVGKLKTAIIENAIYYGTYLLIFGVLLIYVAAQPGINLDGSKLKVICITASNTWGLFLLVLLLGYGLVEIPRSCWNKTKRGYMLNYLYFKAAKLSTERCEAEERVDDLMEEIQQVAECVTRRHSYLKNNLAVILDKLPDEKRNVVCNRQNLRDFDVSGPIDRTLIRLHQQIIRALQTYKRTQCQWNMLVEHSFEWEDIVRNEMNHDHLFKSTFMPQRSSFVRALFTPKLEWYWKCVIRVWGLRTLSVILAIFSIIVVWSEMTFFTTSPTLSLFAVFVDLAGKHYNYIFIEIISIFTIAYLCVCAYYTVFKVRVLNYYYLAPHHQTDEYSLIFSGMLLCRLTPPLCLNFLGLIHLDSHVSKNPFFVETSYTKIMGHMDVISIISDGFNIYFPMAIFLLCLATYFNCGSRILHMLGFEQFLGDDEMTSDLIEEGRELIKREKNKRQRLEGGEQRRHQFHTRFGNTAYNRKDSSRNHSHTLMRTPSDENARTELLRDVEPVDYTEERTGHLGKDHQSTEMLPIPQDRYMGNEHSYNRVFWNEGGQPPKGLFDDV